MNEAVQLAEVAERSGVVFVLTLVCIGLGWLYWQERKDNKALHLKILENSKEMTAAAVGVQNTIAGLKEMLAAVLNAISKKE